jgi:predicted rRNA methylase YqxC with S4 and FtsJ domains
MLKMATKYNPYSDIQGITDLKGQWDEANKSGDTTKKNQIAATAQAYYDKLKNNGYSGVAEALSANGYSGAKKILDSYAPKETTPSPTSSNTNLINQNNTEVNKKVNQLWGTQTKDHEELSDMYKNEYDYIKNTNPFATDEAKAILAKYDLAGLQGRDNVVASGGAVNGGNIDSYSAANAMRQQASLVNQGQMAVLDAHQQKLDNARSILESLGVSQQNNYTGMQKTLGIQQTEGQRLFENDETAKNNEVARKSEIASVTGYVPTEWTYDSNIYLNSDGTVKDEFLTDAFDSTGGFTTIINNAKAKLATTTDPTEKAQLEATIRAATQAKALKTFSSPKYSKYAHEVENVSNPRTAEYDLTDKQMASAEKIALGESESAALSAAAKADAEYQKAYLDYMGTVYKADKDYEAKAEEKEEKKKEQEEKEVKAMTEDKVKGWVDYLNNEVAAEYGADKVALKEKGKNQYERGDIDADYIIMAVLKSTDLTDAQKKYLLIDKFGISEDEINTVLNDPHYK